MLHCRRGVGVLTALAALAISGCASSHSASTAPAAAAPSTSSSAGPAATTTQIFTPYRRSGAPTAGVVAHRSGSCFTKSITVASTSAYRCLAANAILDPCFAAPGSTHVLDCYTTPWAHAVQLRVAKLPSANVAAHVTRPWALELTGGRRCVVTNGTAPILRGVALGYQCTDGDAGLRGAAAGAVLSALYRASDGAVATCRVVTVWRTAAS